MQSGESELERLLKARAEIDEELRRRTPPAAAAASTPSSTSASQSDSETVVSSVRDARTGSLEQRYEILAEAGRGGMGIVYRARDRETGELVALKILKPEIAADEAVLERFKNEVRLARRITHKSICRIHELLRFGDTVAISMEYVEGESLRSVLRRFRSVSVRTGLEWMGQLCAGLAEAHAQGVVHRDLKPENILLAAGGTIKIMDFGIARSSDSQITATAAMIGTPAYMSPEQVHGRTADARSDIYALGLVMYEMFTGRPAVHGETAVAAAMSQIHETPPEPLEVEPFLPPFLARVIRKCMEKDAGKRFQNVSELEAALSGAGEASPVTPAPAAPKEPVLTPRLRAWSQGDWVLLAAAIVGAVVFALLAPRSNLASRNRPTFDLSVLRRIATDYAGKLGAKVKGEPLISTVALGRRYTAVAERAGAPAALGLAGNPVPLMLWRAEWKNVATVDVDNNGSLVMFTREFSTGPPPADSLPIEEVRRQAEDALRQFYGRDPAQLELQSAGTGAWRDYPATSFSWVDPADYRGLTRRYLVRFVGKQLAVIEDVFALPAGYSSPFPAWQFFPSFLVFSIWVLFGFLRRRLVDLNATWRGVHTLIGFVIGAWWAWIIFVGDPLRPVFVALLGMSSALGGFLTSVALERMLGRVNPVWFATYKNAYGPGIASPPCGIGILRGALAALTVLGVDAALVYLATLHGSAWLDPDIHVSLQAHPFLAASVPGFHVVAHSLYQTVLVTSIVAIAAFVAVHLTRSTPLRVLFTAALAAVVAAHPLVNIAGIQPFHWKAALLFVDSLLIAWVFFYWDFLTTMVAMFSFAFLWQNSQLFVAKQMAGAASEWGAFALWTVAVLCAAGVCFQSRLREAALRLKSSME